MIPLIISTLGFFFKWMFIEPKHVFYDFKQDNSGIERELIFEYRSVLILN